MNSDQILKKIGTRIREIREAKNVSQQDLASLCNFEKANMSRIEAGRTNFTISTLYKISQALDVTISQLVDVERFIKWVLVLFFVIKGNELHWLFSIIFHIIV